MNLTEGKRFHFDNMILDTLRGTVYQNEEELPLPKLSFDCLLALLEASPRTVSQEELIQKVWSNRVIGDETLKQRIKLLRKAIGDSATNSRYIAAVRSRGYKIIPDVDIELSHIENEQTLVGQTTLDSLPTSSVQHIPKIWRNMSLAMNFIWPLIFVFAYLLNPTLFDSRDVTPTYTPSQLASIQHNRIALLPLRNLTQTKHNQYIADGISEYLQNQLTQLPEFQVVSQTALRGYADRKPTLHDLGTDLNAGIVIDGNIHFLNEKIIINLSINDSVTKTTLWSRQFSQENNDLIALQNIASSALLDSLKKDNGVSEVALGMTNNNEAYRLYLRGRDYYRRYRHHDNKMAIELYQKAIDEDPSFALSYTGLADAYSQSVFQFGQETQWLDKAIRAANFAINLEPNLAQSYKSLGLAYFANGSLTQSIYSHKQAVEKNPEYREAITNVGFLLREKGLLSEAIEWNKKALKLNNEDSVVMLHTAQTLLALGEPEKANYWFRRSLQFSPDYALAHYYFGMMYLSNKHYSKAKNIFKQALIQSPTNVKLKQGLAEVLIYQGDMKQAKKVLKALVNESNSNPLSAAHLLAALIDESISYNQLEEITLKLSENLDSGSERYDDSYYLSLLFTKMNKPDLAFSYLNKAISQGWLKPQLTENNPLFDSLRIDARFERVISEMNSQISRHKAISMPTIIALEDDRLLAHPIKQISQK